MRVDRASRSYYEGFQAQFVGHIINNIDGDIPDEVLVSNEPSFACFDYDYPNEKSLAVLRDFKTRYPSIPVIMLTDQHSEQLTVWALRSRVWDFIVKPFSLDDVMHRLNALSQIRQIQQERRPNLFSENTTNANGFFSRAKQRSLPAIRYIQANYGQKITNDQLAKMCFQSTSSFSRTFKTEQGVSVGEYLMACRLEKAQALLALSGKAVSQIAYEVGFNDASYFCRAFRRFVGVSPTIYLKRTLADKGAEADVSGPRPRANPKFLPQGFGLSGRHQKREIYGCEESEV